MNEIITWLANKGLAGAISRDLCKKYIRFKSLYPAESEERILERTWNFWLTLNEDAIRNEDGLDKIARLEIMKEEHDYNPELKKYNKHKTLMELFKTVLYIETKISSKDGKMYDIALKTFFKNAKNYGFDSKDYEIAHNESD